MAAIDVGKREIAVAVRVPGDGPGAPRVVVGARFRRLHRRFGKKNGGKAAVAIAHTC